MDSRGGCCIARYGGGGGGGEYDMSKVDRIMLRFRPIAPRPATCGSSLPPDKKGSGFVSVKSCRRKRRYSKENNSNGGSTSNNGNGKRCNRRRREETKCRSGGEAAAAAAITLPLLPETPERKNSPSPPPPMEGSSPALWLSTGNGRSNGRYHQTAASSTDVMMARTEVVFSCVTVECIIDTWIEGQHGLGNTDEEKKMNLEKDTCPGFISDSGGKVTWTNAAYKDLVVGQNAGEGSGAIAVRLVMRERPMVTYTAFTCRVRLEYTCQNKERSSITLPCDVWKMNDGGFAWRLDVKAALCLGR